jgi:sec-independent protein translocase protein TatA
MIPNLGPMELGIVVLIALVIFGPKRLPELGSSLGEGIRGIRQGFDGSDEAEQVEAPAAAAKAAPQVKA